MKHIQSAGGIVIGSGGKVAVITNEIGKLTFPKGTIEEGEKPLDAAMREIAEETGLKNFDVQEKLGVLKRPGFSAENSQTYSSVKHIHMYLCTTNEAILNPNIADVEKAEWVRPQDLKKKLTHKLEFDFFEDNIDKINKFL